MCGSPYIYGTAYSNIEHRRSNRMNVSFLFRHILSTLVFLLFCSLPLSSLFTLTYAILRAFVHFNSKQLLHAVREETTNKAPASRTLAACSCVCMCVLECDSCGYIFITEYPNMNARLPAFKIYDFSEFSLSIFLRIQFTQKKYAPLVRVCECILLKCT